MPKEIVMPLLGFSMEEGQIMQWLKSEGDSLEKGEPLLVVETDKASLEAESHYRGTLYKILVDEGESAPVGAPIALYLEPGEEPGEVQVAPAETEGSESTDEKPETPGPTPPAPIQSGDRIIASPLARKLAQDNSVDLKGMNGSGFGGRIVASDVHSRIELGAASGDESVPYAGARKAIGDKTQLSMNTAPHYYMGMEIDMSSVMDFREQAAEFQLSLNHILIKAVAMALKKNPQLNSTLERDTITFHKAVNIGYVVATDNGMQIPVIRRADEKSLSTLAAEAAALTERVRQGRMQVSDTQEGTFTISNLGMYGITEFTAVINQPQTAILAVGAVKANILKVILSMDHRVVDGVSGAQFLMTLKDYLEHPLKMLL